MSQEQTTLPQFGKARKTLNAEETETSYDQLQGDALTALVLFDQHQADSYCLEKQG